LSRNRWVVIVALLIIVAVGIGSWKYRSPGVVPKYRTADVDRGSVESVVSATGTVRPVIQVEVGSQVSGTVGRLHADYNSRVRAGQVLVELEPSSFRARVVQAEAAVARAEASVKDADRAEARARDLFDQRYVSQADLDAATVAVELRKADLKQAQAQLEAAQVDLEHATIRSPIDGVVIARAVDLGQTVAASLQAPRLFVIANDLSQMQVESRIDEADIGRLRSGLPASFTVDAFPDRTFDGRVSQIRLEPIVEQGVVTYTTVIQTANPDLRLRPGMTANVTIRVERRDDVVRIRNAALRFRPPSPAGGRAAGEAAPARNRAQAEEPGPARGAPPEGMSGGRGAGRAGAAARGRPGERAGAPDSAPRGEPREEGTAPGAVYRLREGRPERVAVVTGITDGTFTEVRRGDLEPGDRLIVGTEVAGNASTLQPPPGMGGPSFRRPGGRR